MKRYVWGVILIALGIMSFLQAEGQVDFGLSFWPVCLTLAGGVIVWGSLQKGWRPAWFGLGLGLWAGCIGLFTILNDAGITSTTGSAIVRLGWPVLLLAIGLSVITGRCRHLGHGRWHGSSCSFGDRHYGREHWVLDGDLDLNHGVGDFVVDLSTADISEGLHQIKIGAAIGELLIRVPDGINVSVDAAVSLGELNVFGEERSGIGGLAIQKSIEVPDARIELRIETRLRIGELMVERTAGPARISP